jgi:hypothetical protein
MTAVTASRMSAACRRGRWYGSAGVSPYGWRALRACSTALFTRSWSTRFGSAKPIHRRTWPVGMIDADFISLDARVQQAALAQRQWRTEVREAPESALHDDPFVGHRAVASRSTFQSLGQLPAEMPLRDALLAWVGALTLDRVTLEDRVEVETAWRVDRHVGGSRAKHAPTVRELSMQAALGMQPEQRAEAATALVRRAEDASSDALFWLARRQEAARQLGLNSLMELEAPFAPTVRPADAAARVLAHTDALASEALAGAAQWQEALAAGTASDAREGWPTHVSMQWIEDLVRKGGWLAAIVPELGSVAAALCGASFARVLSRFGVAYCRAAGRQLSPIFSLYDRPFDARIAGYGWLTGSWLMSRSFLRRKLGLGEDSARDAARSFGRCMLIAARVTALQAAVAACPGPTEARAVHLQIGATALKAELPAELCGVLPRYRPGASSWLAGALYSAAMSEQLVAQFDDDWFDNPRAPKALREFDVATRLVLDQTATTNGATALARIIGGALA